MGLFSERKPYTAISSETEAILARGTEADPDKLVNLVDLIQGSKPSDSGAYEAGRLIRKKMKYGSASEQLRALALVETLVDNGIKTSGLIVDSQLGEQLTQFAASHTAHQHADRSKQAKVAKQCRALLLDWSTRKDRNLSSLYSRAGLVDKHDSARNRRSFHPDDDLDSDVFGADGDAAGTAGHTRSHSRSHSRTASASHRASVRAKVRSPPRSPGRATARTTSSGSRSPSPVNLRGASMETTVATAHNIATRLTHELIVSPNGSRDTQLYYRQAKQLRRRIIELVHDPNQEVQAFIGQLLTANEELVAALQAHDAVVKNHEPLETQDDHDLLELGDRSPSRVITPARPPPSPPREDSSSPEPPLVDVSPPESPQDAFDPFADDNEQVDRPKHTPLW